MLERKVSLDQVLLNWLMGFLAPNKFLCWVSKPDQAELESYISKSMGSKFWAGFLVSDVFWRDRDTGMGLSGQSWSKLEAPSEHPDVLGYMGTSSNLATFWWHRTTWGGGIRSQWADAQQEVWVKNLVDHYQGNLEIPFLEKAQEGRSRKKKKGQLRIELGGFHNKVNSVKKGRIPPEWGRGRRLVTPRVLPQFLEWLDPSLHQPRLLM